jgi:amino acid transporter
MIKFILLICFCLIYFSVSTQLVNDKILSLVWMGLNVSSFILVMALIGSFFTLFVIVRGADEERRMRLLPLFIVCLLLFMAFFSQHYLWLKDDIYIAERGPVNILSQSDYSELIESGVLSNEEMHALTIDIARQNFIWLGAVSKIVDEKGMLANFIPQEQDMVSRDRFFRSLKVKRVEAKSCIAQFIVCLFFLIYSLFYFRVDFLKIVKRFWKKNWENN